MISVHVARQMSIPERRGFVSTFKNQCNVTLLQIALHYIAHDGETRLHRTCQVVPAVILQKA